MCIATGSVKEMVDAVATRLEIRDYFEFILSCEEVGEWKENPLVYEEAMKRLGGKKADTVVFEDSMEAIRTAVRAGFKTVAVAGAYTDGHKVEIDEIAGLYITDYNTEILKSLIKK